jgi:hypothetical protein
MDHKHRNRTIHVGSVGSDAKDPAKPDNTDKAAPQQASHRHDTHEDRSHHSSRPKTHPTTQKPKVDPVQKAAQKAAQRAHERKSRPSSLLNLRKRRAQWYVVIRHACDEKDHTTVKHKHDSDLCNNKKHNHDDILEVVKELVERCAGEPDQIFTSPLERCVATAKQMSKCLKNKPEIVIERNMSRFFSKSEQEHPEISKRSLKRGVPITETKKEFEHRIEKHLNKMEKSPVRVIWCVTHALVMKRVDMLNQEKHPWEHIFPLEYRIFEKKRKV